MPFSNSASLDAIRQSIADRLDLPVEALRLGGPAAPETLVIRHHEVAHLFLPVAWSEDLLVVPPAPHSAGMASPLIVADRLDPAVRARLREARLDHADRSGAIWIRRPGLVVDVDPTPSALAPDDGADERAHDREPEPRDPGPSRINPFAPHASLVLRALLSPAHQGGVTQKVLQRVTGRAKGFVSQALAALVEAGYVAREGKLRATFRVVDPVRLLLDWQARRRRPAPATYAYRVDGSLDERERLLVEALEGLPWALTLHAAGRHLAPHVVQDHVHACVPKHAITAAHARLADDFYLAARTGAEERAGANLHLLVPRDGDAALFDARTIGGVPVVSPVQLFLDLAHWPVRGAEAIDALVHGVLGHDLALDAVQRRRLLDAFR